VKIAVTLSTGVELTARGKSFPSFFPHGQVRAAGTEGVTLPPAHPRPGSLDVVDLVAIADACAPAVACYDEIWACAERGDRPDPQTKDRLHDALRLLRGLPRCGGRLGRAITVVANGGVGSSVDETLAALEMLRATLGLRPGASRPVPTLPSLRLVGNRPVQLGLPGFEVEDGSAHENETQAPEVEARPPTTPP
jgi:hypothetical protein